MFTTRAVLASFFLPMATVLASEGTFSYNPAADDGPANWAALPIENNQCNGQKNSPIAVTTSSCDRFEDYTFSNGTCDIASLTLELTGTGVKASYPADNLCENPTVVIPGIEGTFKALQFHIHTSSEHTIDGSHFGAELHTVHQQVDGDRLAVVGMFIQPDADVENEEFEVLLQGWLAESSDTEAECATERGDSRKLSSVAADTARNLQGKSFSPYQLIPAGSTYYQYDGGLTTPPCTEIVWWNIVDTPVSITPSQYQRLVNAILNFIDPHTCEFGTFAGPVGSTSRPVQALNGRTVERICPVGFKGVSETSAQKATSGGDSLSYAAILGAIVAAIMFV